MIRVLLVTTSREDFGLTQAFLDGHTEATYQVDWASSSEAGAEAIRQGAHDAYLVDAGLEGGRGMALLAEAAYSGVQAPIILLVPSAHAEVERSAIREGATEVLVRKDITPPWLERSIRHAIARREREEGPNRGGIQYTRERLSLSVARARRERTKLSVLLVQLTLREGEASSMTGEVRNAVEGRIQECLRDGDSTYRYGGSFVVVLEGTDDASLVSALADAVLSALSVPLAIRRATVRVKATMGVAMYPADGESAAELLSSAESAAGTVGTSSSGFRFATGQLNALAERRVAIKRALVGAVARNEFQLFYQPQIDISNGKVVGAEALLRWTHGELGRVSPADFIPILEATDGINEVGEWVIREATARAGAWARAGAPVQISVNVSARQFQQTTLVDTITSAMSDHALSPELLGVEITEGMLLDDSPGVREALDAIRKRGLKVAVDDFGTGYASLSYVKRFPMDTIKIDREFVRGLPLDVENGAITNAIVALARSLSLKVVAEGVETEGEQVFLSSLGCEIIQGFLHAKPMSADDFGVWRGER